MVISYIQTDTVKLIKVVSPEITTFINSIGDYTGLEVILDITCGNKTPLDSGIINTTNIIVDTNPIYVSSGDLCLYITPTFLGLQDLIDAIYNIEVKLDTSDGYTEIKNCAFLDITYSCRVAKLLNKLLYEMTLPNSEEKVSTIAHILHYSLVNGSNCGCNCTELCAIFCELRNILTKKHYYKDEDGIDFNNHHQQYNDNNNCGCK